MPLGFPVPTIKIASNHDLATRKPGWIDFDAGMVLDRALPGSGTRLMMSVRWPTSAKPPGSAVPFAFRVAHSIRPEGAAAAVGMEWLFTDPTGMVIPQKTSENRRLRHALGWLGMAAW
jgi:hypothetical protein